MRGRDYCGYYAATPEKFFGWRLHLICTPEGLPVSFAVVAGSYHDLTPLHELTFTLPPGACVFGEMYAQHLHARTNAGFEIKVHASLLALACSNIN